MVGFAVLPHSGHLPSIFWRRKMKSIISTTALLTLSLLIADTYACNGFLRRTGRAIFPRVAARRQFRMQSAYPPPRFVSPIRSNPIQFSTSPTYVPQTSYQISPQIQSQPSIQIVPQGNLYLRAGTCSNGVCSP